MRLTTPSNPESGPPSLLPRLRALVVIFKAAIVVIFRAITQSSPSRLRSFRRLTPPDATTLSSDANATLSAHAASDSAPTGRAESSNNAVAPNDTDERATFTDADGPHGLASGRVSDQPVRTKARKNAKRRRTVELPAAKFIQVAQGRYIRVEISVEDPNLTPEEDSRAKENSGDSHCARDAFPEPKMTGEPDEDGQGELIRNETATQSVASDESSMPGEISVVAPDDQQTETASRDRADPPLL